MTPASAIAEPPAPIAVPQEPAPGVATRSLHPALPAVASAVLLWMAFPPVDAGHLGWVALVPLGLLVTSDRSRRAIYLGAWLGGMVFWHLAIQWIRLTDASAWLPWTVMATFLSLWWPVFVGLSRIGVRRFGLRPVVVLPVVWLALEYARAYVLTGFPWYYLAHTQYLAHPVVQVSDIAGAWGVSFVVAAVNALLVEVAAGPVFEVRGGERTVRRALVRDGVAVGALVAATLLYGAFRLATARFERGPVVGLLQSNIGQQLKLRQDARVILETYVRLMEKAMRAEPKPDLLVWPETSYPYRYIKVDPALSDAVFAAQIRKLEPKDTPADWRKGGAIVEQMLHGWTDASGIPMLVGLTTAEATPKGLYRYNSAVLFQPANKTVQSYHKLHLVPFGEYVPLIESFPWLRRLTPYEGDFVPSLSSGGRPDWFTLGPWRLASAICFEDSLPDVVRLLMRTPDGRSPDVIVNISNDGWFQGSSELDEHLAVSTFRAVEHRVPVARCVNTGISAVIDGNGVIRAQAGKLKETALVEPVPLDSREAVYTRFGDWLPATCFSVSVIGLLVALLRRQPKIPGDPSTAPLAQATAMG